MPNPKSLRSDVAALTLALVAAVGCGRGACFETALAVPTAPRQPDGVLVEPPPAVPRGEDRGNAAASVVSLRPPISDEQVTTIVKSYVRALEDANPDEMMALYVPDAVMISTAAPTPSSPRANVRQFFQERMRPSGGRGPNPFITLRGLEIAQLERIERFEWTDLTKTSDPQRPNEMRDGDLMIRVPLVAPLSPNGEKLVGDILLLMLRRDSEAKSVRIAGVAEMNAN